MAMIKTVQSEKIPMISLAAASSIVEPVQNGSGYSKLRKAIL
jgi:hypothetical protein